MPNTYRNTLLRAAGCLLMLAAGTAPAQAPPAMPAPPQTPPAQAAPAAARNQAGVIILAEGDARIAQGGAGARAVKVGDVVSEGDMLITGKNGEMHLTMQDTGFIALRPNTRFRVVSYKADGGDDDGGIFRLIEGGFRSVTGWIGKFNTRGYQVRTPTATIGIRGTDHEPRYIPEGSSEGEPGTYDRVFAGQTFIETPTGQAAIAPDQAGFVSLRPREKPRLLAAVPAFFRPGPHEAEIERKHEEIQKRIDQRREERRKAIAEKRAELEAARAQAKQQHEQNKAALAEGRKAAEERLREIQARRDALQKDAKAAQEMVEDVQKKRKALQEDIKSGQIAGPELRQRRMAILEEAKAAEKAMEDVKQRRKALQEASDAKIDERYNAVQERLKAMHDQQLNVRDKRKTLDEERESAGEEIKTLRQQENKRYLEELREDRKSVNSPGER